MSRCRSQRRGFTLLEIVIGVGIMAITFAISTSMFLNATTDARAKECRANMMTIANLEQEHRIKDPNHAYTTSVSALQTEVPNVPVCPSGGSCTITLSDGTMTAQNGQVVPAGHLIISCSASGHGKFAPDIDTY